MRYARRRIRWMLTVTVAIGLVLMLPSGAFARGNPNQACPTDLIAKFEANGPNLVFEKGTDGAITISNVATDDDNEPVSFDWTSTTEVGSIIVKGGQQTQTFSGDTTSIDFGSPPAISNVQFCAPEEDEDDGESGKDEDDTTEDDTDKDDEAVDSSDDAPVVVGDIPTPTRIDTGAGGASASGPSLAAIMAALTLAGVTFASLIARLIRRRG
jgi:hypothetical protein